MSVRTGTAAALLLLVLGQAALAQTPPPASPEPVNKDAKCLALGVAMNTSANNDDRTRAAGNLLTYFYLGRISAAGKQVDLDRALEAVRTETRNGAGPLRDDCSALFTAAQGLTVARPDPADTPAPAPSRTIPAPSAP